MSMQSFSIHPNSKTAYGLVLTSLTLTALVVGLFQFVPLAKTDDTLVFMRLDGHDMEIFSIEADGSNEIQLTHNEFEDWAAIWSVDKSEIYFHSNREGYYAIYRMKRDGTDVQRLTPEGYNAQFPALSPDGHYMAFQMDMDFGVAENWDIFIMGVDGCSSFIHVTHGIGNDGGAAFSPDGSQIAYHSTDEGYFDIYVVNVDGTNTRRLTNYIHTMDVWPQWSADGSQILFHSERTGNSEIFVMNADGSNPINLSNNSALDRTPRYSADGQHILFRSERDGGSEIFIMNLDGSNPRAITQSSFMSFYPNQ